MTKKHYEAIAAILAIPRQTQDTRLKEPFAICVDGIAEMLADYFATDNPKFDRARFLEACGIEI